MGRRPPRCRRKRRAALGGGAGEASSYVRWEDTQDDDPPGPPAPAQQQQHAHEERTVWERYYEAAAQGGTPVVGRDLAELQRAVEALKRPLPVTFRVAVAASRRRGAEGRLAEAQRWLQDAGARRLGWVDAVQLGEGKHRLGLRHAKPGTSLADLQRWLVGAAATGDVTRQEAVSMVPAALLGVRPGHAVLDLCASPGSKTTQLLELLHADPHEAPTGFVVANDFSPKRAYMLVRRCLALGAPCERLLVTCHAGQRFPHLAVGRRRDGESREGVEAPPGIFDRVVCDVPCCGDGTLRKNPEVWRQWTPEFGIGLHPLQVQIALRGLSLLKVGGRMAYSTCTFSPMEDEAVVAELLRRTKGAVRLVDASGLLPGLERRPGLSRWRVLDDEMVVYNSYAEAKRTAPAHLRNRLVRSLWPPTEEEAEAFQLSRCLRLLPHLQDTGGFFVALLEKVAPLPRGRKRAPAARDGGGEERAAVLTRAPERDAVGPLREALGLGESFDVEVAPTLLSRAGASPGTHAARVAPELFEACLAAPGAFRLKAVWAGYKALELEKGAPPKVTQEALPLLMPHVSRKAVAELPPQDLRAVLRARGRPVEPLSAVGRKAARKLKEGPCVLHCAGGKAPAFRLAAVADGRGALATHFTVSRGREHAPKAAARALEALLPAEGRGEGEGAS